MDNNTSTKANVIVIGGTGSVGKHLIRELVNSNSFNRITSLVRNEDTSIVNEKLKQVVVDFELLEDYKEEFIDKQIAIDVFGTTRKQAGSAERFREIEMYQTRFSSLCKEAGVQNFILLSSQGANPNSWFLYPSTKGQVEDKIISEDFHYLSIFRPSFLNRGESNRTFEKVINKLITCLDVESLAKCLVYEASNVLLKSPSSNSVRVYSAKDIDQLILEMQNHKESSSLNKATKITASSPSS